MKKEIERKVYFKKRSQLRIFFLLLFTVAFSIITIVFSDSLSETKEQQRKEVYGKWHGAAYGVDEDIIRTVSENVLVENAETMYILGSVLNQRKSVVGTFGCIDSFMEESGDIELLSGHWPTSANEVAIEAAVLTQLGYSYETGQKITLSICSDDLSQGNEEKDVFNLCGVVKDYSGNWKKKSENSQLVSIFVYPSFTEKYKIQGRNIFINLYDKYAKYASDLNYPCKNRLVLNDYSYLMYSNSSSEKIDMLLLQIVFLLTGMSIFVLLVNNEILSRQTDFVTLRILGATRGKMVATFFREKIGILLSADILGVVVGIFLSYILFFAFSSGEKEISFLVDLFNVLKSAGLNLGGAVLALALGFVRIFQLPLRGNVEHAGRYPSKSAKKILCLKHIFLRFKKVDKGKSFFSIALSFFAIILFFVMAYSSFEIYREYDEYRRNYPIDYSYGTLLVKTNQSESDEAVRKIENAYGIGEVYTYSISNYEGASFSCGIDEEYMNYLKEELLYRKQMKSIEDYSNRFDTSVSVVGISDNLWEIYADCISNENSIKTIKNNEIVLYLPDFYLLEDGSLEQADLYSGKKSYIKETISEQKINVGDEFLLQNEGQQEQFVVAGIIRRMDEKMPFCYRFTRPFSALCCQEEFSNIFGRDNYSYILVNRSPNAIAYQTDVELSRIKTVFSFTNYNFEKERYQQDLSVQLILTLTMSVSGVLMVILARNGIQAISDGHERNRYNALYRLGMLKGTIRRYLTMNAVRESLLGCILAGIVGVGWLFFKSMNKFLGFEYKAEDDIDLLSQILDSFSVYTQWGVVVVFVGIAFIINTVLLIAGNRKITEDIG